MKKIGILDPEGINPNPLTGKPYSDEYKRLSKIWSKYPAYENAQDTVKAISSHQVILVTSGTGSGKTVLIPKFVLHSFNYSEKIAVTLPKQIIAQSAAQFSAKTLDVELGQEIGFQYRGNAKFSDNTKILYATDGTIVAQLLRDPELKQYSAIVIDEAHERKLQIDFLLYLLKQVLTKRPEFKLVIMSATINHEIFKTYFNKFKFIYLNISGQPNYPIKSIYLQESKTYNKLLDDAYDIILNLPDDGDILLFVMSSSDAYKICRKINESHKLKHVFCIEVYSGMNPDKQLLAEDEHAYKQDKYTRKLVIATNVAESSITIQNINYVIDTGYEYKSYYNPIINAHILKKQLITKAQVKQRMGRTGRTKPGTCYHMYSKQEYDKLQEYPLPDIHTSDITDECLRLLNIVETTDKLYKMFDDFIEPPVKQYITYSLKLLTILEFVDKDKITELGRLSTQLMAPLSSKAVLLAKKYDCSREMIKIMSLIESCKSNLSDLIYTPQKLMRHTNNIQDLTNKYNKFIKKYKNNDSDHLTILNIINGFENHEDFNGFVNINLLKKNKKNYYRIMDNLKNVQDSPLLEKSRLDLSLEDRIIYCLKQSHIIHTGYQDKHKIKIYLDETLQVKIASDSLIKNPKYFIYDMLFINDQNIASLNICTKI